MMKQIWVLSDFHLSFGVPNKSMVVFGDAWTNWTAKIQASCEKVIKEHDLLLIAGDISWASSLDQAKADLEWIHELPGTKVLLKGNHDHWWPSSQKLKEILPPSIHFIYNSSFNDGEITIGGSRLWDCREFSFSSLIEIIDNPLAKDEPPVTEDMDKIFDRELHRLELSLKQMNPHAKIKIAMTHYPPVGLEMKPTRATKLLEAYGVHICVFGHLHNIKKEAKALFGELNGIKYHLTSCDYLDFKPLKISEFIQQHS